MTAQPQMTETADAELDSLVPLLARISWTVLLFTLGYLAIMLLLGHSAPWLVLTIAAGAMAPIAALVLIARGRYRSVRNTLIAWTWAVVLFAGVTAPANSAALYAGWPLLIAISGLLLGRRAALLSFGAVIACQAGLYFLTFVPSPVRSLYVATPATNMLALVYTSLVLSAIVFFASEDLRTRLARERKANTRAGEYLDELQERAAIQTDMIAALAESEERFRQLAENIGEVFWLSDASTGRMLYISPAYEAVWGRSCASLYADPRSFMDAIVPADQPLVHEALSAQQRGRPTTVEYRIGRPDGSERWIHDRSFPIHDEAGRLIRVAGLSQDISGQRRAADALSHYADRLEIGKEIRLSILNAQSPADIGRVLHQKLSDILPLIRFEIAVFDEDEHRARVLVSDAPPDALTSTDTVMPISQYTDLDARFDERVRYVPDLGAVKNPGPLLRGLLAQGVRAYASILLRSHDGLVGELNVGLDAVESLSTPDLDLLTDIADAMAVSLSHYALLDRVRSYAEELEERVELRTSELKVANAELMRANRLKDEFMANMSHELRTPLNAIITKSAVMEEGIYGELSEKQRRAMTIVGASANHLLELINDILDLSKVEAGMMDLEPHAISVRALVDSCLSFVRDMATRKRIGVMTNIHEQASMLVGDERRLKQILVNLLSNAVKFTPEHGRIGLDVRYDEPRTAFEFAVWDTGIGIENDDIDKRLFQPFVQLQGGLSREFGGTGLGLALVKRLVDLHGGSIVVDSEVGVGTRFTVTVPANLERQAVYDRHEHTVAQIDAAEMHNVGKSILVAEDNEFNLETVLDYLTHVGYEARSAVNGVEVLDAVHAAIPDLILMDIQMPRMDGLETMAVLKGNDRWSRIPIIAVTALAMPGDRERCLQAGAVDYLSKPVSLTDLLASIEQALNGET